METINVVDPGPDSRGRTDSIAELHDALKRVRKAQPRGVLISVAGDAWDVAGGQHEPADVAAIHQVIQDLHGLSSPVVVWLEGAVTGYGLTLALACDLRFCGPDARLGLGDPASAGSLDGGASWLLRDRIGSALHEHLMWTAECLTAAEAAGLRLVSGVGDRSVADRAIARITALPLETASALKRSTRMDVANPLRERMTYEARLTQVTVR